VLAKTGVGLEVLEVDLENKSDEVRLACFALPFFVWSCGVDLWCLFQVALQVPYKQVGMLLPNVRVHHGLRLRAVQTAGKQTQMSADVKESLAQLAVWTRRPLRSTLRCVVFPSGSHWDIFVLSPKKRSSEL